MSQKKQSIEERKAESDLKIEARRVKAEEQSEQNKVYFIYLFIFAAILIVWNFFWFFGVNDQSISNKVSDWGAFGDFIGGLLNPAVAGVGLIFFIKTLKQNEEALRMSAEELAETRFELERSTEAQSSLAASTREQFQNSISARALDETIKNHDYFHEGFLKSLRAFEVNIRFSNERVDKFDIESAMLKMFSSRKQCVINSSGIEVNLLEAFKDLSKQANELAYLYSDVKVKSYNTYGAGIRESVNITPRSHYDLINFCRFISLAKLSEKKGVDSIGLLDTPQIRKHAESTVHHMKTNIDNLTWGFEDFKEKDELKASDIFKN